MEKSKTFILLKSEQEAVEMYKETALKINNQFLTFDKTNPNQKESDVDENFNKSKTFKIPNAKILKFNNSIKKLVSSSSQKYLHPIRIKGNIQNDISIKKTRFILPNSNKYKNFYNHCFFRAPELSKPLQFSSQASLSNQAHSLMPESHWDPLLQAFQ